MVTPTEPSENAGADANTPTSSADIPPSSYQQILSVEYSTPSEDADEEYQNLANPSLAKRTLRNFILMSALFSANHGCVVACLALASAQLGSTGAWQSGILYLTYTASALLGATFIVKKMGARDALWLGMGLYCAYVACFWIATTFDTAPEQRLAAWTGAAIGGVGAGFLWTAQGAYFSQAAEEHAGWLRQPVSTSTAYLAGIFAFLYLAEEVLLRLLSSVLVGLVSWKTIFGLYTLVTVASTVAMPLVYNYPKSDSNEDDTAEAIFYKVTAAGQLLWRDPKMKYMIGLNAVFGFTSAFLNSYVNGQVVPVALNDPEYKYIGLLSSWVSAVAAGMSLVFGQIAPRIGKGPILLAGSVCFLCVSVPFMIQPNAESYGWLSILIIYMFHGMGRATFEGTLKATFADYFAYEKEGAFANIILQNGLSGAIGYIFTFALLCDKPGRYCVKYNDGTLHDVLTFEVIAVVSGIAAIIGYLRASVLRQAERRREQNDSGEENSLSSPLSDGQAVQDTSSPAASLLGNSNNEG